MHRKLHEEEDPHNVTVKRQRPDARFVSPSTVPCPAPAAPRIDTWPQVTDFKFKPS